MEELYWHSSLTYKHDFLSRMNFWGYSTINYFSPMIRYSSAGNLDCGHAAINEFKLLVKEAHKREIEVTFCFNIISDHLVHFLSNLFLTGDHGRCFQSHC